MTDTVLTPSSLNRMARQMLESEFGLVWVEGEISNLSRPSSGHLYFTLKDAAAQVRCALFRNRAVGLRIRPENGQVVRVRARVSVYEARGDYQLIAEAMEAAGEGALQRAFEALRDKLAKEGLFDEALKRALPGLPRRVGVITSPTGAAIRDVLSVLKRRYPGLPVLIYPVPVQGDAAAPAIVRALALAGERRDCDVLLLVRGGGSLEDLWPFNEEAVARAIRACPIPVVCGVGHEVDVTIADFAADHRAPTPSAAAELISPDGAAWLARFTQLGERLARALGRQLRDDRQRLTVLQARLERTHPRRRLQEQAQRLDELELALSRCMLRTMSARGQRLDGLVRRLKSQSPERRVRAARETLVALERRLRGSMQAQVKQRRQSLDGLARTLHAVSPLATLGRGYAIVEGPDGIVREADAVAPGERVTAILHKGRLVCRVEGAEE